MAEIGYLASALVTGVLLLAVWALIARMENWRRYELSTTEPDERTDSGDSIAAWIAGFLALVAVVGGGAVLLVSNAELAAGVGGWVALAAAFGVLLLGYLLWGTYSSARNRGLPSAHAALLSAWLFGSLAVGAISLRLILA